MKKGSLTLSRRVNESVEITLNNDIDPTTPVGEILDKIIITPTKVEGNSVKINFQANKSLSISRTELNN